MFPPAAGAIRYLADGFPRPIQLLAGTAADPRVLGEDLTEYAPRARGLLVIVAQRVGTGGERLPEGPATPARPCRLTRPQPLPERLPALGGQQCPCDCQVAGRIADAA